MEITVACAEHGVPTVGTPKFVANGPGFELDLSDMFCPHVSHDGTDEPPVFRVSATLQFNQKEEW